MNSKDISPENVSQFIEKVLTSNDPTLIGLKRILKKKEELDREYPVRTLALEEFSIPEKKTKILNEEERHILELEKKVAELEQLIKQEKEKTIVAIQNAFIKGKKEGFESGVKEGKEEAAKIYEKKIDELQSKITTILEDINIFKKKLYSNTELELLHLSLAIAKKIVNHELSVNKELILHIIKNALEYIGSKEKVVIRVAENDFETVSGRKDFWIPVGERLKDIIIEPDPRIEKGGCIIESSSGLVDSRISVKFEEIASILEKAWNELNANNIENKTTEKKATTPNR
ncbi:MAG: FliH/SctL family protein [Chitinispirillaceae bacterium]|nr:FliH/SctL family protein [Chitinispirillaceae bacterium]